MLIPMERRKYKWRTYHVQGTLLILAMEYRVVCLLMAWALKCVNDVFMYLKRQVCLLVIQKVSAKIFWKLTRLISRKLENSKNQNFTITFIRAMKDQHLRSFHWTN